MHKKNLALGLTAALLILGLTSCGQKTDPQPQPSSNSASSGGAQPSQSASVPAPESQPDKTPETMVLVPFSLGIGSDGSFLIKGEDEYTADLYLEYDTNAAFYGGSFMSGGQMATQWGAPSLTEYFASFNSLENPIPASYSLSRYYDLDANAYVGFSLYQDGVDGYYAGGNIDDIAAGFEESDVGEVVTGSGVAGDYPYSYAYVYNQEKDECYFYCQYKITEDMRFGYYKLPGYDGAMDPEQEIEAVAHMIVLPGEA